MLASAHLFHVVASEKCGIDIKARYVAGAIGFASIPVAGNLHCVRLIEYWIENRLSRKSRRKRTKLQRFDQVEFGFANRTIQCNDVHAPIISVAAD